MSDTVYEELLGQVAKASKLESWLDDNAGGKRASIWEANLWALANLAAGALHYFLREIVKIHIDILNSSGERAGAQAALDLTPPQPASAADLKMAVHAFLETQRLERDDTGKRDRQKAAEPADQPGEPADEPAAAVASALRKTQPERRLPVELIALWAPEERLAVKRWCEYLATGGDGPAPEVLTRTYLEDLRLGATADRTTLLSWIGLGLDAGSLHWSEDLWQEVLAWASAVHRLDRGERRAAEVGSGGVELPETPAIFLPDRDLFAKVKAYIHHGGDTPRCAVVAAYGGEHPGVGIAVDALLALGEIGLADPDAAAGASSRDAAWVYTAEDPDLGTEVGELQAAAAALARREDVPPRREADGPQNFYGILRLCAGPLGGSENDDTGLRYSGADKRPEDLLAVAVLPYIGGFRGVIEWDRLDWTEDPALVELYRDILEDEQEERLAQAREEERTGGAAGGDGADDLTVSVGADGKEPVVLGPEVAENVDRILGGEPGGEAIAIEKGGKGRRRGKKGASE